MYFRSRKFFARAQPFRRIKREIVFKTKAIAPKRNKKIVVFAGAGLVTFGTFSCVAYTYTYTTRPQTNTPEIKNEHKLTESEQKFALNNYYEFVELLEQMMIKIDPTFKRLFDICSKYDDTHVFKPCCDTIIVLKKNNTKTTEERLTRISENKDERLAKFRGDKFIVVDIIDVITFSKKLTSIKGDRDDTFEYKIGDLVVDTSYNENIENVMTKGIYYYKTIFAAYLQLIDKFGGTRVEPDGIIQRVARTLSNDRKIAIRFLRNPGEHVSFEINDTSHQIRFSSDGEIITETMRNGKPEGARITKNHDGNKCVTLYSSGTKLLTKCNKEKSR